MKNEEEGILIKKGRGLIGKVLQTRFTNEKERASLETGTDHLAMVGFAYTNNFTQMAPDWWITDCSLASENIL